MRHASIFIALAASAVLIVMAGYLSFVPSMALADANDNVTINVTIETTAEITVSPPYLFWSVSPGHAATPALVDIKNTGSINVSQIYIYSSTLDAEAARPYGSSSTISYASGGIVVVHNDTDLNTTNWFVGRLEWNSTSDVSNKNLAAIDTPVAFGFFRNTSYEYFWGLGNGTDGQCNNTGAQFGLNDAIDNGTVASRTVDVTSVSLTPATDWGLFSVSRASSPLETYCVAAFYDCTKIYVYKYDKRSNPDFGGCTNSRYLQELNLISGDTHTIMLNAYAPYGIPDGVMNVTTFTVYASSA
jgi:hypothetical protein